MSNKVHAGWFNVRYNDSLSIFDPVLQFLKDFRRNKTGQRANHGRPVMLNPWRVSSMKFENDVGSAGRLTANTTTTTFYMLDERLYGCRLDKLAVGQGFSLVEDDKDDDTEVRKVCIKLDDVIAADGSVEVRAMSFEGGGIIVLRGSTYVEPISLSILASSWV